MSVTTARMEALEAASAVDALESHMAMRAGQALRKWGVKRAAEDIASSSSRAETKLHTLLSTFNKYGQASREAVAATVVADVEAGAATPGAILGEPEVVVAAKADAAPGEAGEMSAAATMSTKCSIAATNQVTQGI
jgi:hypothetical protein